jgi:hypothetical protein
MVLPTLLPEHGYLMLSSTTLCLFSAFWVPFRFAANQRSKVFGKKWAESKEAQAIIAEHNRELPGIKHSADGYPDMGNGRYSDTLSYANWFKFNLAQRAHYRFMESFPAILGLHVLSGVYFPVATAILAPSYMWAYHVFGANYIEGGPENRYSGIAAVQHISVLGWLFMAIAGSLKMIGAF